MTTSTSVRLIFMTILILISAPFTLSASPSRGYDLLKECTEPTGNADIEETVKYGQCASYITGMFRGMLLMVGPQEDGTTTSGSPPLICAPGAYNGKQLAKIVVHWLSKHPERLGDSERVSAFEAFQEAFPCNKK